MLGFTCDVWGREVQGITFVNGMKFCAKCYQETFGNDNNLENNAQYTEQLLRENAQLKKEIEILRRALDLACDDLLEMYCSDYCSNSKECEKCPYKEYNNSNYFIQQAKEKLNEISGTNKRVC